MASNVIWFRMPFPLRPRPFLEIELETVIGVGAGVPILVDDAKRLIGPPRLQLDAVLPAVYTPGFKFTSCRRWVPRVPT